MDVEYRAEPDYPGQDVQVADDEADVSLRRGQRPYLPGELGKIFLPATVRLPPPEGFSWQNAHVRPVFCANSSVAQETGAAKDIKMSKKTSAGTLFRAIRNSIPGRGKLQKKR